VYGCQPWGMSCPSTVAGVVAGARTVHTHHRGGTNRAHPPSRGHEPCTPTIAGARTVHFNPKKHGSRPPDFCGGTNRAFQPEKARFTPPRPTSTTIPSRGSSRGGTNCPYPPEKRLFVPPLKPRGHELSTSAWKPTIRAPTPSRPPPATRAVTGARTVHTHHRGGTNRALQPKKARFTPPRFLRGHEPCISARKSTVHAPTTHLHDHPRSRERPRGHELSISARKTTIHAPSP